MEPELAEVVNVWKLLDSPTRRGIMALIRSYGTFSKQDSNEGSANGPDRRAEAR